MNGSDHPARLVRQAEILLTQTYAREIHLDSPQIVAARGRSVVVRVNDRGPFGGGVIDLTEGAAKVIGMLAMGVGSVRVQVLS